MSKPGTLSLGPELERDLVESLSPVDVRFEDEDADAGGGAGAGTVGAVAVGTDGVGSTLAPRQENSMNV